MEVGKVIHAMQRERDMSVLYLSSIGPETKTFLTTRYLETDDEVWIYFLTFLIPEQDFV